MISPHGFAPFRLGIQTSLSSWRYGLAPFRLVPATAPETELIEEECENENKKTEEQILEYLLAVSGEMAHPLHPSKEGVQ